LYLAELVLECCREGGEGGADVDGGVGRLLLQLHEQNHPEQRAGCQVSVIHNAEIKKPSFQFKDCRQEEITFTTLDCSQLVKNNIVVIKDTMVVVLPDIYQVVKNNTAVRKN
jgi:hypothetical protein